MAEYNQILARLTPELPKVIDKEQIFVYVPKATFEQAGVVKPDESQFTIGEDGQLSLRHIKYVDTDNDGTDDYGVVDAPFGREHDYDQEFKTVDTNAFVTKNNVIEFAVPSVTYDPDMKNIAAQPGDRAYVYAYNDSAVADMTIPVSSDPVASTIAMRDFDGALNAEVPDQADDTNVVNVKYTNDTFVKKRTTKSTVFGQDSSGKEIDYPVDVNANSNTIPIRNTAGNIFVASPTIDDHAATKGYVDAGLAGKVPIGSDGKVPPGYLPDGVDEVIYGYYNEATDEFYEHRAEDGTLSDLISGVEGKLYADRLTARTYLFIEDLAKPILLTQTAVESESGYTCCVAYQNYIIDLLSGWAYDLSVGDTVKLSNNVWGPALLYDFRNYAQTSACVIGDKAYTFGGKKKDGTLSNEIYEWDLTVAVGNEGRTLAKKKTAVLPAAANEIGVVYTEEDGIMLFGGCMLYNGAEMSMNAIYSYDPATDTISTYSATLPNAARYLKDRVLVADVGGTMSYVYLYSSAIPQLKSMPLGGTTWTSHQTSMMPLIGITRSALIPFAAGVYSIGGVVNTTPYDIAAIDTVYSLPYSDLSGVKTVSDVKLPLTLNYSSVVTTADGVTYLIGGFIDNDSTGAKSVFRVEIDPEETFIATSGGSGVSLQLGTTHSTAYYGDYGKIAYDHANSVGNPHNTDVDDIIGLKSALDDKLSVYESIDNDSSIVALIADQTSPVMCTLYNIDNGGTFYEQPIGTTRWSIITSSQYRVGATVLRAKSEPQIKITTIYKPIINGKAMTSTEITLPMAMNLFISFDNTTRYDRTDYFLNFEKADQTYITYAWSYVKPNAGKPAFKFPIYDCTGMLQTSTSDGVNSSDCVNIAYWKANYKPFNYTTVSALSSVEDGFNVEYQVNGSAAEIEIPMKGTDDIIVDIDEANKMINVHLDAAVRTKIGKALLLPTAAPTETSLVGITKNNAQSILTSQESRDALSVFKTVSLTQSEYNALGTKDSKTLYLITG